MKVYQKRGALNYKEKRLVSDIEKSLEQLFEEQPELAQEFEPAKNFEELKSLYAKYCVTDTEFTEVPENKETTHEEFRRGIKDSVEPAEEKFAPEESQTFVDPFNEAEPIVRDYVQSGGLKEEGETESTQTEFDEPTTQKGAFEMPSAEAEKGTSNNNSQPKAKKPEPPKPINPKFDDMSDSKKKRSTKRFAKIIIEGVCLLAEKGCIWWTTKDITEDKLVEYEIDDVMDLQILLSLEDGQQATVREWFGQKVNDAQTLFKVSEADKSDLIDSLYEVMLEKGVAPTPMQELIINAVKTFVLDMGLKAFALSSQINNVLGQLKSMKVSSPKQAKQNFEDEDEDFNDMQDIDNLSFENPATNEQEEVTETGLTTI
jgi:hypothetical protein